VSEIRWASASDTIVEHESEAAARVYEFVATIVHRHADGPWLTDAGHVWDGDPEADRIRTEHEALLRAVGWRPPPPPLLA
jgi:hypothetical protein